MENTNKTINAVAEKLRNNYYENDIISVKDRRQLPNRAEIIHIIDNVKDIMFPGYFSKDNVEEYFATFHIPSKLMSVFRDLKKQIRAALQYGGEPGMSQEYIDSKAEEISARFIEQIPEVQNMLLKDIQAGFDGDPAAKSKADIIFSYPGFYAIFVYRLAHILYQEDVPFIPRIMTEHAHSETGIDINSGAEIGEYFFIDHGTGIVIGETCVIGNNVKIYQGVTLGALSTRKGQMLSGKKRHPTIEDNVTIYSNASILGGATIIGENSTIGGNCFITESVPAGSRVSFTSE